MMKYNTLSTSSLASEGKKSSLTIYTEPDYDNDKMIRRDQEAIIKCELEIAQRALKLQTRRCRQLVAEFTRKLQEKDLQIISERHLREDQISKVLRSLLVFESRLKQEQKLLRHELSDRDDQIHLQRREIRRLRFTIQFCKTCSQLCHLDTCESGSEYCLGSWESGSEFCASVADSPRPEHSSSGEETVTKEGKVTYEKNKHRKDTDSYKRPKKKNSIPRRTTGTYFEVLKLRESEADSSIDDASSEKTEKEDKSMDSLSSVETIRSDPFSIRMNSLHGIRKTPSPYEDKQSLSAASSDCDVMVQTPPESDVNPIVENLNNEEKESWGKMEITTKGKRISDTITVFDSGEGDANDSWYASASDAEDEDNRDIYRNNPVLECMNQILLQNINDIQNTPPQSPELDRNKSKSQKRVKFSDENVEKDSEVSYVDAIETKKTSEQMDYYETPIQVPGNNFYEVPQSIYSNDYEQILSKCGEECVQNWPKSKTENIQENKINRMSAQKMTLAKDLITDGLDNKHYYVDMDTTAPSPVPRQEILKKTKVARTPPALPPKPANLVSKFKIQSANLSNRSCEHLDSMSVDSEPDYCSISELNLPPEKIIMPTIEKTPSIYSPISLPGPLVNLVGKTPEKNNMQSPRQAQVPTDRIVLNVANISQINMLKNKKDTEIPKLPQVSEIIIPDENEENTPSKLEHISQDNYIKNNSQLLKQRLLTSAAPKSPEKLRGPIVIGSSVSSLISGFNNHLLSEIGHRKPKPPNERLFSNFEMSQSFEKPITPEKPKETPNFEKFDLSQNFEEFKLDDCEIFEDYRSENSDSLNYEANEEEKSEQEEEINVEVKPAEVKTNTSVEIVRATNTLQSPQNIHNLQQLQKNLHCQRNLNEVAPETEVVVSNPEPSYEHFLECTGLSSKSILTPSRTLSNNKSILKPKHIKLRSKVKSAVFEHSGGTIKYWSEPYL